MGVKGGGVVVILGGGGARGLVGYVVEDSGNTFRTCRSKHAWKARHSFVLGHATAE